MIIWRGTCSNIYIIRFESTVCNEFKELCTSRDENGGLWVTLILSLTIGVTLIMKFICLLIFLGYHVSNVWLYKTHSSKHPYVYMGCKRGGCDEVWMVMTSKIERNPNIKFLKCSKGGYSGWQWLEEAINYS